MHKKFEINRTKIKGGCQSGRKVVTHNAKSDLPIVVFYYNLLLGDLPALPPLSIDLASVMDAPRPILLVDKPNKR